MNPKMRRFNLGDLMILIAALALATMAMRNLWQGLLVGESAKYYWDVTPVRLMIAATLSACATPLTLACLAFRLRQPRPTWRRLAILPGTATLIACSVIFVAQTAEVVASLAWPKVNLLGGTQVSAIRLGESLSLVVMQSRLRNGLVGHIEPMGCFGILTISFASPCGPAVAAVWLVLALSGRWRPEGSWIDRSGRLLGATWILISLLAAIPIKS
jgi:hypothetical protein